MYIVYNIIRLMNVKCIFMPVNYSLSLYVCTNVMKCMYVHMYVCMYVYIYVCMYVYMYVCIRVCTYVCMYVCMYIMYMCLSGSLKLKYFSNLIIY